MSPNFELLDEALTWAEAAATFNQKGVSERPAGTPDWDQGYWFRDLGYDEPGDEHLLTDFCTTSCCIAGYVATRKGEKPLIEEDLDYAMVVQLPDGSWEEIESYARHLLGLTIPEAARLFEQENTLNDLRTIVAELKEKYS